MLDYLLKFKSLPKEIHQKLSSQRVMGAIDELEKKYELSLVSAVMRIAIKEIPVSAIKEFLMNEYLVDSEKALSIEADLKAKIFSDVADYLGFKKAKKEIEWPKEYDIGEANARATAKQEAANRKEQKDSPFYYFAEDEEEIKNIAKDGISNQTSEKNKSDADKSIEEMIREVNIHFSSEATEIRLRQILKTYFLGIRDRFSTKLTLGKTYEAGGLGIDDKTINLILTAADKKIANLKESLKEAGPTGKNLVIPGGRDFDYDLKNELAKGEVQKKAEKIFSMNILDTSHEIAPPHPALRKNFEEQAVPIIEKTAGKEFPVKAMQAIKPVETAESVHMNTDELIAAHVRPLNTGSGKKVKMDDVVYVPKEKAEPKNYSFVMTPIDEIKNMDSISFRRLSMNPKQAAEKLKEKIQLLEDEDYSKKVEGIKGWRNSPIYKLYLRMGQDSIIEKKSIGEVIQARQTAGQDTLTSPEFEAVMDLNKSLRF